MCGIEKKYVPNISLKLWGKKYCSKLRFHKNVKILLSLSTTDSAHKKSAKTLNLFTFKFKKVTLKFKKVTLKFKKITLKLKQVTFKFKNSHIQIIKMSDFK